MSSPENPFKTPTELDDFFLGDLVSTLHGDCSVPAANANARVQEIINNGKLASPERSSIYSNRLEDKRSLYDVNASSRIEAVIADTLQTFQSLNIDGDMVELHIVRPRLQTYEEIPVPPPAKVEQPKQRRVRLGRKAVEAAVEVDEEPKFIKNPIEILLPPKLVAMFGYDLYVPLATFDHITNTDLGACRFIQIGAEMYDENFYTTVKDEAGPRHELVKVIRNILNGVSYDIESPEQKILIDLIREEVDRAGPEWLIKREAQLTRQSERKVQSAIKLKQARQALRDLGENDSSDKWTFRRSIKNLGPNTHEPQSRALTLLDEPGMNSAEQVGLYVPLMDYALLPSGRRINFALVKQTAGDNTLNLYAVTRGNVALPLVEMAIDSGILKFAHGEADLTSAERLRLVRKVSALLSGTNELSVKSDDISEDYKLPSFDTNTEKFIAEYLHDLGILNDKEFSPDDRTDDSAYFDHDHDKRRGDVKEEGKALQQAIKKYLKEPALNHSDYENLDVLSLAVYRLLQSHSRLAGGGEQFQIDERLDEMLGETSPIQERLYETIVVLAKRSEQIEKILRNIPMRSGTVGDIRLKVMAQLNGSNGSFIIKALPVGTPETDEADYLPLDFDTTQPLFKVHEAARANPDAYAANVVNLLGKIVPTVIELPEA